MKKFSQIPFQFNNNVEQLRKRVGFSQTALAAKINISRSNLAKIETGKVVPSVFTAILLAQKLHVRVESLFTLKKQAVLTEAEEFELEIKKMLEEAQAEKEKKDLLPLGKS